MNKTFKIIKEINQFRKEHTYNNHAKDFKIRQLKNKCIICENIIKGTRGYYRVFFKRKRIILHRLIYSWCFGNIPKEKSILHRCNNNLCVNINHLKIGTYKDNSFDAMKSKRNAFGERSGVHKLLDLEIKAIKILYRIGKWIKPERKTKTSPDIFFRRKYSHKKLGNMFGVKGTTIYLILNRKSWKHIR